MMNDRRIKEALDLLQEECGEVIQARSKVRRFGPDFRKRGGKSETTAHEELQHEVWDLMILLSILEEEGYLNIIPDADYELEKIKRLSIWTTLYDPAD
jgi:NTP pyrophosphatase (non-canonical NTP hydrolase)